MILAETVTVCVVGALQLRFMSSILAFGACVTIPAMKKIQLRAGKERSLQRRHPWIFESSIAEGAADAGETLRVESHEGVFMGWAAFSPASKIRARVWSFDESQPIDAMFIIAACEAAVRARGRFDINSDSMRLVHGESDRLPRAHRRPADAGAQSGARSACGSRSDCR